MKVSFMSDKKGVSLMVSYVLLIAITISLSIMVFTWLRFFAGAEDAPECPAGVNVVISDYNCNSGPNAVLNVTIKNKGRFTVDEFLFRVNDRVNAEFGLYKLDPVVSYPIEPGRNREFIYFVNQSSSIQNSITLFDVQPLVEVDGEKIFCKSFSTQEVTCP